MRQQAGLIHLDLKILEHNFFLPKNSSFLCFHVHYIECSPHNCLFTNDSDITKKSVGFSIFRDPNSENYVLNAMARVLRLILK